jgi:hypothetical protein
MTYSEEDCGKSRRPGAEDRGWSHRLGTWWPGGREVGWHRVWSAPGMWRLGARVSWLSLKTRSMVCEWFGLKTTWTVFTGLASKPVTTVSSGLASKPVATVFSSLTSKLVVTVSPDLASKPAVGFLVEAQNQGGGGFSGLGLKTCSSGLVISATKSPRRFLVLGLKTKQTSVCRLRHETNGGKSVWDTHRDLAACLRESKSG